VTALLTAREASGYLRLSYKGFLRLLRSEPIPHTRIGRQLRFTKDGLDQAMRRMAARDFSRRPSTKKEQAA
jgi:excisionase family DNA binding protein